MRMHKTFRKHWSYVTFKIQLINAFSSAAWPHCLLLVKRISLKNPIYYVTQSYLVSFSKSKTNQMDIYRRWDQGNVVKKD